MNIKLRNGSWTRTFLLLIWYGLIVAAVISEVRGQSNETTPTRTGNGTLDLITSSLTFLATNSPTASPLNPGSTPTSAKTQDWTVSQVISASILIVCGTLFIFFGRYLLKTVVFVAGFYLFALITLLVLLNVEPKTSEGVSMWGEKRELIYAASCVGVGLIGGAVLCMLWRLGLFAVGSLGGFCLATLILGWTAQSLIPNDIGRNVFIAGMTILGGILALFIEHDIIIISTALTGAYLLAIGIDTFLQTGFGSFTLLLLKNQAQNYQPSHFGPVYGLLIGAVGIALVGIVVQYRITGRRPFSTPKALSA